MDIARMLATIPAHIRRHAEEIGCAAVGFGTATRRARTPAPIANADWSLALSQAVAWLAPWSGAFRWAHIVLTDGTVLWFGRRGFRRTESLAMA